MHLGKDGGVDAWWKGWGVGQVLVSGDGEVCAGGHPAGECVRVNGLVCGSMCDPPSSRQSALAHTWMSLHVGTRGSRVQGRMGKKSIGWGCRRGFWSWLCCQVSKALSLLWASVSPSVT